MNPLTNHLTAEPFTAPPVSKLALLKEKSKVAIQESGKRLPKDTRENEGPGRTGEFRRIINLPVRPPAMPDEDLRQLITQWLRLPLQTNLRTGCCHICDRPIWTEDRATTKQEAELWCDERDYPRDLFDAQARTIAEVVDSAGGLAQLGVGAGKTLTAVLVATAFKLELGIEKTGMLVPSKLVAPFRRAIERYRRHWLVPHRQEDLVIGYGRLSVDGNEDLLARMGLGALVCDEAHSLRKRTSARTRRFSRLFKEFPGTRLVCLSGNFVKQSPLDYWHLAKLALGDERTPLPKSWPEMQDWAHVVTWERLQEGFKPPAPGCLSELGTPLDTPAEAFARRVMATPGIVSTKSASCDASITCGFLEPNLPRVLAEAVESVLNKWEIPDGHVIVEGSGMHRAVSQLCLGFYSKLRFPEDIDRDEWYEARRAWSGFCRSAYSKWSLKLDAELPVINAIKDGRLKDPEGIYERWRTMRAAAQPWDEVIWLDRDWAPEVAQRWLGTEGGLLWTHWIPPGERIAEALGIQYYGGGTDPEKDGPFHSAILSVNAHAEGRNLQFANRNLALTVTNDAMLLQQLVGRTHRSGQRSPNIEMRFYTPTELARAKIDQARLSAKWLGTQANETQRLCLADWESDD